MQFYRPLNAIKALSFDLDDTLYDNRPVIQRMEAELTTWLHEHYAETKTLPTSWWQAHKQQIAQREPELCHDVTLWRFRYMEQGFIALGYSASQARCAAQATVEESLRLRSDFHVPQETHRVLQALAQRLPLIAITNGNVDVERIGLAPYFQQVLQAGKQGRAKPYPDLFALASQALGVDAASMLHVGDHPVTDVLGALNHGCMACWFNDQHHDVLAHHQARLLPHLTIERLDQLLLL